MSLHFIPSHTTPTPQGPDTSHDTETPQDTEDTTLFLQDSEEKGFMTPVEDE